MTTPNIPNERGAAYRRAWTSDEITVLPNATSLPEQDSDEMVSETELTATAEVHTGAMIALVPTEEDAQRIAMDGGEDPDQLHVTLMYLGEAAMIPPEVRENLIDCVASCVGEMPTIVGDIFAVNLFNPEPGQAITAGGKDPCVVWGVGGDLIASVHEKISHDVEVLYKYGTGGMQLHPQHKPWVAHITATYVSSDDEVDLSAFVDRVGPITFDRIRLAFGGENYDIPLGENGEETAEDLQEEAQMTASSDCGCSGEVVAEKESDVNLPGGSHNLRNYWVRGPGAAKIGWGTDGSFARCVRNLSKYVARPQGLCAEYHKQATGEWPAEIGRAHV